MAALAKPRGRPKDPVGNYARAVVSGKVPAGKWHRLACQRHLDDRKRKFSPAFPYKFKFDKAQWAIEFFGYLRHTKGEWGKPPPKQFILEPWQEFIVGSLFGWRKTDGTRRFRISYTEVPRKNGKSTLSAGIALLLAFFDNEPGAEVYCAATKRDQAKIVWDEAKRMVARSPFLNKRIRSLVANLNMPESASKLEPLGADNDTLDGLNIHGAIVDEIHAHKSSALVDVLETATGARRQPLQFEITTAGFDKHSICWQHHEYTTKIVEGIITDHTWFGFIACADPDDDWTKQSTWAKANPNLGVSVKLDDLKRKCVKAKELPAQQNAFRQKHLDEWTEQAVRWLSVETWDKARLPRDEVSLAAEMCFGGLDLASTQDICALVLAFPDGEDFDLLCRFWVPEEGVLARSRRDRVPYEQWVREGYITATPGNVTDYAFIRNEINKLASDHQIVEIAYDPWNATQLAVQLAEDGANMVEHRQGFASMAGPTREVERLVLKRGIRHGRNPVLRWMASNVAIRTDPQGNMKIDKDKSTERVDGMVALAMAIGRAVQHMKDEGFVYADIDARPEGFLVF